MAIKPIPACLHLHASIDAAAALARKYDLKAEDIESVRVLVPREAVQIVCEPVATRRTPQSSYAAQFSLPYAVASGFIRGRFSLQESNRGRSPIRPCSRLLPASNMPSIPIRAIRNTSGEVIALLRDGREVRHREGINRGSSDRPLTSDDIARKFRDNAALAGAETRANEIMTAVLGMDQPGGRERLEAILS